MRTITLTVDTSDANGFAFEAGQYLGITHPNGTLIPLSIASGPSRLPQIELLYRSDRTSESALAFDDLLANASSLQVEGPFGDVTLSTVNPSQELRIVASGTGIAQALSLVEALSNTSSPIPTQVLWATKIETHSSERLLQTQPWLKVTRCDSNQLAQELISSVNQDRSNGTQAKTIIAGPPDFVYQVCDELLALGIQQEDLAADAFAYAPR